jgi:CheY-like chemotaxis protein
MSLNDRLQAFRPEFFRNGSDEIPSRLGGSSFETAHIPVVPFYQHCILCVDDDVPGTRARAEILRERGYSVHVCHSPLAALRCDLSLFDLAILDFNMPELNGRELLLRMRASGARFPIVLLSGRPDALSHDDRVLFARCIDKAMPVDWLLDAIAAFFDANQIPDYGS